jgi:iron complex outermembrane receptor protein
MFMANARVFSVFIVSVFLTALFAPPAAAQGSAATPNPPQEDNDAVRFTLPTVTVTAEKVPENVQDVPASVTAVSKDTLDSAAVHYVGDAAIFAPNVLITDWSARKLSNARFRGIGSSPNNPGVTTYIDGVPQLNGNSSSLELIDVNQIEFVRGPQGALYGRNTLGGLINIVSTAPSRDQWTGSAIGPFGNFNAGDVRLTASGPVVADKLSVGVGLGYSGRDGFTKNDVTGHAIDTRSAFFGKGQLLWTPTAEWQARVILTGERARDGDYGLMDLAALRANPFHASRDYEGFTHRDIVAPTFLVSHSGSTVDVSTVTGFVWWKTEDFTDLDYTARPLITRDNNERDLQFTEEVRLTPARNVARPLTDQIDVKWQAGVFIFTQRYQQDAVNNFSPFVLSQFLPFAVSQHSPQSSLDDNGVGTYGQGTLTFAKKFDATFGVRVDREDKSANLNVFYAPAIAAPSAVNASKDFSDVSPQVTGTYHIAAGNVLYITAARGFKAGGFNSASPAGSEAYGPEHSWNYEAGAKTSWLGNRLTADGAVFVIDWRDLQLNVPNPAVPAQFYISNVGSARSKGVELSLLARPIPALDVFGSVGYTDAHFGAGTLSSGVPVGGNWLPTTPEYTANIGATYSHNVRQGIAAYGRFDVAFTGSYKYNDTNTVGQDAYSLANVRAGVRGKRAFGELWMKNAFDTKYIPVAFAYGSLAPSGFLGEMGAPRTYGVRVGLTF